MALMPVATRNRVNPISISNVEQSVVPYGTYGHVGPCNDPYCLICRPQRHDRHRKHHHHKQHHHHHHHKKHKHFWDDFLARGESASSTVTVHSIELDERRPYYDRALVPVNQAEKQVVSTTRTERIANDDYVREAWTNNPTNDDEIVCCRAYNGCRCPCWCCIILIILFVILLIILIVLLATLL